MDIQSISTWLQGLWQRPLTSGKRLALTFSDAGIAVAALASLDSHPAQLEKIFFQACPNPEEWDSVLRNLVKQSQLKGYRCSLVLQPTEYRLILLDALDVPTDELAQAARWRVQSLHNLPADDVAVDAFFIPHYSQSSWRKKMYTVVSRLSALQEKRALIEQAGLQLDTINIVELALRNLADYFATATESIALLVPQANYCLLLIVCQQQVYLARGFSGLVGDTLSVDDLLREIQRSYDYCLSELGLPRPQRLLLVPTPAETQVNYTELAEQLNNSLQLLDMTSLLCEQPTLSASMQRHCFIAMGGALRLRETADAAN